MNKQFAPITNFGQHPVYCSTGVVASPTANTTTTYNIPVPYRASYIEQLYSGAITVPVDADGTLLVQVKKYDAATDADVLLTAGTFNLESLVTKEVSPIPILATLSDKQRKFNPGDTIRVEVTSNSAAIDTAAVGLYFGVELLRLAR